MNAAQRRTPPPQPTTPTKTQPAAGTANEDTATSGTPTARRTVSWRSVLLFTAVVYGVLALCAAPFWMLEGGIAHPLFTLVIGVGMFAPTIARWWSSSWTAPPGAMRWGCASAAAGRRSCCGPRWRS